MTFRGWAHLHNHAYWGWVYVYPIMPWKVPKILRCHCGSGYTHRKRPPWYYSMYCFFIINTYEIVRYLLWGFAVGLQQRVWSGGRNDDISSRYRVFLFFLPSKYQKSHRRGGFHCPTCSFLSILKSSGGHGHPHPQFFLSYHQTIIPNPHMIKWSLGTYLPQNLKIGSYI